MIDVLGDSLLDEATQDDLVEAILVDPATARFPAPRAYEARAVHAIADAIVRRGGALSDALAEKLAEVVVSARCIVGGGDGGDDHERGYTCFEAPRALLDRAGELRAEEPVGEDGEKENAGGSTRAMKHKNDARSQVMISYDKIEPMIWDRF